MNPERDKVPGPTLVSPPLPLRTPLKLSFKPPEPLVSVAAPKVMLPLPEKPVTVWSKLLRSNVLLVAELKCALAKTWAVPARRTPPTPLTVPVSVL